MNSLQGSPRLASGGEGGGGGGGGVLEVVRSPGVTGIA